MSDTSCPSVDELYDLVGNGLPAADSRRVGAHLEACPCCQSKLESALSEKAAASSPKLAIRSLMPGPDREFLESLRQQVCDAMAASAAISTPRESGREIHADANLECPTSFGGYEIIGEIARGGMAIVYKARQPHLGRIVALKRLRLRDQDASDIERFLREAEAVARLHHPNIVQVFQVGEDGSRPFLALEYVAGPTLAEYLNGAPVDPRSAAELLRKVALAVHHAHKQGIIHRDLKPANVLLSESPADLPETPTRNDSQRRDYPPLGTFEPKVADFGLARRIGDESMLTLPDMLAGTPAYLAPEQLNRSSEKLTPACDVYSLGAILYEMLTGRPPLLGPNVLATLRLVENADPVPPHRLQLHLSRDLEAVCLKCLAKDANRRYPSAADLAADLERFLAGRPTIARPLSLTARTGKLIARHPIGATALASAAVAALIGLSAVLWQWREAVAARGHLQVALNSEADQRRDAEENLYYGRLAQATNLWENGNASQARELLAACRPSEDRADVRGWEWQYLSRQFRSEIQVIGLDHWVNGLVPFPGCEGNPSEIAIAVGRPRMNAFDPIQPGDGRAEFLSLQNPTSALREGPKLFGAAQSIAVHPSGKFVAWGLNTGAIVVARKDSNEIACTIQTPAPVYQVCFSADGAVLLATSQDSHLRSFDAETGQRRHDQLVHVGAPWALASQPNSSLVACGGWTGRVQFFDPNDLHSVRDFVVPSGSVISLSFASSGSTLAAGCREGSVSLWDMSSQRETRRIQTLGGPAYAVAFSPDGNALAVGGADRTIRVYDPVTERLLATYRGHESSVRSLAFSSGGDWLLSGGQDGKVRVWDATKDSRGRLIPFRERLNAAAFCATPNGLAVIAAGGKGQMKMWSLANGRILRERDLPIAVRPAYPRRFMAFLDGGTKIVGIDKDNVNNLVICDTTSGRRLTNWSAGAGPVQVLATDRTGRLVTWATTAGENGVDIHWRDRESGDRPAPIHLEARSLVALAIDPMNGQLAAVTGQTRESGEQSVWAFDLSGAISPKEVLRGVGMTGGLSFSPDGNILAVSDHDSVNIYRACKWNLTSRIPVSATTTCLTFSSDGRRLAAVGYDGDATLLDPAAGKRVFELRSLADRRPDETASDGRVAFSPDGSCLLSTNWDGSINVWDGTPVEP